jgi:hypothetical protein
MLILLINLNWTYYQKYWYMCWVLVKNIGKYVDIIKVYTHKSVLNILQCECLSGGILLCFICLFYTNTNTLTLVKIWRKKNELIVFTHMWRSQIHIHVWRWHAIHRKCWCYIFLFSIIKYLSNCLLLYHFYVIVSYLHLRKPLKEMLHLLWYMDTLLDNCFGWS